MAGLGLLASKVIKSDDILWIVGINKWASSLVIYYMM
jgi:hypothetical protein